MQIYQFDVLKWIEDEWDGKRFHALFCDPPYHLGSIVRRFGKGTSAPAQGDVFRRQSRGFMGQQWDGGDVAFRPETWAALASVLYPGSFVLAFASPLNYHRMAVAVEDAGLMLDYPLNWHYSTGMPKGTNIASRIDKRAGAKGRVIERRRQRGAKNRLHQESIDNGGYNDPDREGYDITEPVTEMAQVWNGRKYDRQSLKPTHEMILVARVPHEGATLSSVVKYGTGAWNIPGARIEGGQGWHRRAGVSPSHEGYTRRRTSMYTHQPEDMHGTDRYPSMTLLTHDPACEEGECIEGCPVRMFDAQGARTELYHRSGWIYEQAEALFIHHPKVSSGEREAGFEGDAALVTNDGRPTPIDNPYQRGKTPRRGNNHATLKPVGLTEYLARLIAPPDYYAPRRLFVPFAGTGSEMIGAFFSGEWDDIVGVELEAYHVTIAETRMAYAKTQIAQWRKYGTLRTKRRERTEAQLSMFE